MDGTGRPTQQAPTAFERETAQLKRRLIEEATEAISMLEASLEALFLLDEEAGRVVRRRDDDIDINEVAIEQACLRLLTLYQPVAHDFRLIAFVLKVNCEIERIADNAVSIAKILRDFDENAPPQWPTSLRELALRVPLRCHEVVRIMRDEDAQTARDIIKADKIIDRLERRLFDETVDMMARNSDLLPAGLLIGRLGRTLERVGDLGSNIAESVIYLSTGEIVRHAKRRKNAAKEAGIDAIQTSTHDTTDATDTEAALRETPSGDQQQSPTDEHATPAEPPADA